MKTIGRIVGAALIMMLIGCTSTEFQAYEAREKVIVGTGGTKSVTDGIEFWENGDPPRTYEIIGVIDDDRPNGIIQMAMFKGAIAAKVKEVGGDAVIMLGADRPARPDSRGVPRAPLIDSASPNS